MNAAQVRAKARAAMRRREEDLEAEEREGGELNLVPYLDIITNIVLFLLFSVTAGIVLGTINSSLPEYNAGATAADNQPNPNDEPPLQLVTAVTKNEILLFSLSGLEGTLQAPKVRIPAKVPGKDYDMKPLEDAAQEIVTRRWGGRPPMLVDNKTQKARCVVKGQPAELNQCRPQKATEMFLMVDGDIPYNVVISAMDVLREAPDGTMLFPGIVFSSGIQ
jgi:biopolymer transport protein ExbD